MTARHFVDVASSRTRPPVTTLCDRSGRALVTLDEAGTDPRIAELRLDPPALTEFKSRDGASLFGAYYAPKATPPGVKVPLVVMVYGGPHVQTVTESWTMTADLTAQLLDRARIRGLEARQSRLGPPRPRLRGGLEPAHGDGRGPRPGRRRRVRRRELARGRHGASGHHRGQLRRLHDLALPDRGPRHVPRRASRSRPVTDWDGYDTCYTERYMGTPANNPEGYRDSSVLTGTEQLRGPLLVIHGMLDENVHFRHTARLTTALLGAGKPFEMLPLPESRHCSRREVDRKYVAERLLGFFESNLGTANSTGK